VKKRKIAEPPKAPLPVQQPKKDSVSNESLQSVQFISITPTKEEPESYIEEEDDDDNNYSSHDVGDESLDLESQICMETSGQAAMRHPLDLEGSSSHASFQGIPFFLY